MKHLRDISPCTSGNQLLDTSNSERILKTYTEQIWVNEIVLHSWFLKEASPPFSEPWALLLALREFRPVLSFSGPYCSNCNICKHRAFPLYAPHEPQGQRFPGLCYYCVGVDHMLKGWILSLHPKVTWVMFPVLAPHCQTVVCVESLTNTVRM